MRGVLARECTVGQSPYGGLLLPCPGTERSSCMKRALHLRESRQYEGWRDNFRIVCEASRIPKPTFRTRPATGCALERFRFLEAV